MLRTSRFFPLLCSLGIMGLIWLVVTGCGGPPQAGVIASVQEGQAPLEVIFSNSSQNADRFEWDFGDGDVSQTSDAQQSVSHRYTRAGRHTVTLTAIGGGDPPQTNQATLTIVVEPGLLTEIVLDTTDLGLEPAEEHTFRAELLDEFGNPIVGLVHTFSVDDRAGRITPDGIYTSGETAGTYKGAVRVEASQGGVTVTTTASVTVEPGPLESVVIEPASAAVTVTETQQFAAQGLDRFENPIPGLTYSFAVQEVVGQVSAEGVFTAGTTADVYPEALVVEATEGSGTRSAIVEITIASGPLHIVSLEPSETSLEVTGEQEFTVTAVDEFDNEIADPDVVFNADPEAGSVNTSGKFVAGTLASVYADGVRVEVTDDGVTMSEQAKVTVEPGPLDSVTLEPSPLSIEVAQQHPFQATGFDRFGNVLAGLTFSFTSDEGAGRVNPDGTFTAGTEAGDYDGAVTVEVSQDFVTRTASADVTLVHGPLTRVLVSPDSLTLNIDETRTFNAQATDMHGNLIPDAVVTWAAGEGLDGVSNDGAVTAGTLAGTFEQAISATATFGESTAVGSASVTVSPDPLDSITLAAVEIPAGEAERLEVIATDRYGNRLSDVEVAWMILDSRAGSVTSGGELTARQVAGSFADSVQAQVIQNEVVRTAVTSVSVVPSVLHRMLVGPERIDLGIEMTQEFVAVGVDRFGNRILGLPVAWELKVGGGNLDPDGVFTAGTEPGTFDQTIAAIATQGDIEITGTATVNVEPDRIAFLSDQDGQVNWDLYVTDLDGDDAVRVTRDALLDLTGVVSWSPDGRRLLSYECAIECLVFVVNDDGRFSEEVITQAAWPDWAPRHDMVTLVGEDQDVVTQVYLMDIDGGRIVQLTSDDTAKFWPIWSPDMTHIAYTGFADNKSDVFVIDLSDLTVEQITATPFLDYSLSWSPDGTRVAFTSDRDGDSEIYVMDPGGANLTQLTFNTATDEKPSWSPDGQSIVFHSDRDGDFEIYTMRSDGSRSQQGHGQPGL